MTFYLNSWDDPTSAGRGRKANVSQQAILDTNTALLDSPWARLKKLQFGSLGNPLSWPDTEIGTEAREARTTRPRRGGP